MEIKGRFAANAGATTVSFSVQDTPLGIPVVILPADTVKIRFQPNLDLDGNGALDLSDLLLVLKAINNSLPNDIPGDVAERLGILLDLNEQDLRLDVNDNGLIDVLDTRIMLRYQAGLRGPALGEGAQQEEVEALLELYR